MEEGGNANVFKYLYHHFSLPFILCTIMRHDRIQLHLLASCSDLIPAINMCAITSRPTAQDRYTKCTLNSHARSVVMDVLCCCSQYFMPSGPNYSHFVPLFVYVRVINRTKNSAAKMNARSKPQYEMCIFSVMSILASRQRSR